MVVVTTGTNKCATKRAAHGSHQYGRERSHHCGRGNHHSVMLLFAKTALRMISGDHWDDVGMRHWDDDWEGGDWGDHWDGMMMMMTNRMIRNGDWDEDDDDDDADDGDGDDDDGDDDGDGGGDGDGDGMIIGMMVRMMNPYRDGDSL